MKMRTARTFVAMPALALVVVAFIGRRPAHSTAAACESLAATQLPQATITAAQPITQGSFTPPGATNAMTNLPPFCRVAGVITPTNDSRILFEVWLPLENWSGRFVGVGNGGWAGTVSFGGLAQQIRRGNAAGSTDTGHPQGPGLDMAKFAYGHPERLVDFSSRSVHEMTVKAKALTQAFYDKHPAHSYWVGCSTGGKQGLTEAQRFPADYDGIVAGAPANNWTRLMLATMDVSLAAMTDSAGRMGAPELELLNRAVLAACDTLDGVGDRVLEDPRRCTFDPGTVQCTSGSAPGTCLTTAQVNTARRVYQGPNDPVTGAPLYPGLPFGSERAWEALLNPSAPFPIAASFYKWLVFADSLWDPKRFDVSRPTDYEGFKRGEAQLAPILSAIDPDLSPFRQRGGKLIQWHGWNDQLISAQNSIDYYESVLASVGGGSRDRNAVVRDVQRFFRLYMAPGVLHCAGGPGPNTFDLQGVLEKWVEQDVVPEAVIATRSTNGVIDRSRPLCPYPKTAVYNGRGDPSDASNFACGDAR